MAVSVELWSERRNGSPHRPAGTPTPIVALKRLVPSPATLPWVPILQTLARENGRHPTHWSAARPENFLPRDSLRARADTSRRRWLRARVQTVAFSPEHDQHVRGAITDIERRLNKVKEEVAAAVESLDHDDPEGARFALDEVVSGIEAAGKEAGLAQAALKAAREQQQQP